MNDFLLNTRFTLVGLDLLMGLLLYFYTFAVLGWIIEMLYLSTAGRGLINSGFLQGPVCPAYAAGALIIYPFTLLFSPLPFALQCVMYAILATIVEYIAHYSLEKLLKIRIWDYSDVFMNFQGRISLKYSVFWFALVLVLVLVLQPLGITVIQSLAPSLRMALALSIAVVFIADYIVSGLMFGKMKALINRVIANFSLPVEDMNDLEFNRPRIMNEKKHIQELFSKPEYVALDAELSKKLFSADRLDTLGFKLGDYGGITEQRNYKAWRESTDSAKATYARYVRIAELSYAFCRSVGLDGTAAARGMLLSAYRSDDRRPASRLADFLLQQTRILRSIRKDIGPMGRVERDVVARYKWPLNFAPPMTKEALVASLAEKIVQSKEFRMVLRDIYAKALE